MQLTRSVTFLLAVCGLVPFLPAVVATAKSNPSASSPMYIDAGALKALGTIDERFQSFAVGFSGLTGTRDWISYDKLPESALPSSQAQVANVGSSLYEYRPPIDLTNRRLVALTSALAPAYIRYSGTQGNLIYFQDDDKPRLEKAPDGFRDVLTRKAWRTGVEFAKATNSKILTSFAVSDGVRDAEGNWTSDQAERFVRYTQSIGGDLYAAELFNEPNLASFGGGPKGYNAASYARDMVAFNAFVKRTIPTMRVVGPGDVTTNNHPIPGTPSAEQLFSTVPRPRFDVVSYHFYGAVSRRCAPPESVVGTSADKALSEEWLSRTDASLAEHRRLRDIYAPGAPIWNTETGGAACGGSPWSSTFLDSFRFIDQQGRLARGGLSVIVNANLVGGDYGMIDGDSFEPRPNYWAALLWRRLMGTQVLDAGALQPGLHLYAHCQRGNRGGVTILAINLQKEAAAIRVKGHANLYALTATELRSRGVLLNGHALALGRGNAIPALSPQPVGGNTVNLAPTSINFVVLPNARNAQCYR